MECRSLGDSKYLLQPFNAAGSLTLTRTGVVATPQPQKCYIQWERNGSPSQRANVWKTGIEVRIQPNTIVEIYDIDHRNEIPDEKFSKTVEGASTTMLRQLWEDYNRCRSIAINGMIARFLPTPLATYFAPPPPRIAAPPPPPPSRPAASAPYPDSDFEEEGLDDDSVSPWRSVEDRVPTPIPYGPSRLETEDDTPPPPPPRMQGATGVPIFVATLLKQDQLEKEGCCPISLTLIKDLPQITCTSCYHLFDPESLNRWLETKDTCPVCKQTITSLTTFE